MSRVPLIVWLVSFGLPVFAQKKPVTLDAVTQSASRSGEIASIVWAPDRGRFVYQSGQTIWIYDAAAGTKREVAALEPLLAAAMKAPVGGPFDFENRRVRENKIQWSPDGRDLLLLVGGDLFLWHLESAKWQQLTTTALRERDPKLSPDGRRVSFCRENELYVLDIATRKVRQLTHDATATRWNARLDWVYPEELDLGTAHWWSPDSRRIAYLQFDVSRQLIYPHSDLQPLNPVFEPQRYPKAGTPNADVRLGVVGASGGKTRWMDTGDRVDALLARVKWMPDGKSVVVQRLNRVQNRVDLIVANASSGTSRTLLHEENPHWVNVSGDLFFLRDGKRFVWSSERSGFRHLYLQEDGAAAPRQLTSGDWEASPAACVDEAHERIYFVSTERTPLERHLFRAGFDGAGKTQLTTQPGTHAISMSPDCRYYTDSHSSATEPPSLSLHSTETGQLAVLRPADRKPLDEYELLPVEFLKVPTADGDTLYAKLTRPAGFTPGKRYPAIVMVYGGPHAQDVRNAWTGLSWDQALAQRGFVVWQLDNRGTAARGHAFEAKLYRRLGRQELADQKTGVEHLVSLGFVDPVRIGVYGWSYGGFLTLYSLLNEPDLFRAGVAGAPVVDWRNYDSIYTERYLGLPSENAEGYKASSPVHQAANLKSKLMLVHNFEDDNVLYQNSLQMMVALQAAGKQFEVMVYPQKTHGVTGTARRHMLEGLTAFFERSLAEP